MNATMPPWFNAILAAIRGLLIAAGALMIGLHYEHGEAYKWIIEAAGATMIIGPLVWGMWAAGVQLYHAVAVGVASGIEMTVQGKAVTDDGKVINQFSADGSATPPRAVTVETAKKIVADFAPTKEIKAA